MKVIIIGGVAAGTKAAAKLRRLDPSVEVLILTKGKDISYAGCGLPYYVGKVIEEQGKLIVNTPESFQKLTGVQVETLTEVTGVMVAEKKVQFKRLTDGTVGEYSYDKLVIASGADAVKPPLAGIDLKGVYFMRTPDDAIALRSAVEGGEIKRAIVGGGGFIGLEVAENLAHLGVKVSIVDMADQILPGFDPEIAFFVENHLADQGIMCFTNTKIAGIEGTNRVEKLQTEKRAMKTDAVVLSLGIRPNTAFLEDSGIQRDERGLVLVNEKMETNCPDVYAVGDCVKVHNRLTGSAHWSPMGSSANIEGRIVAQAVAGENVAYSGVLGTGVAKLPGLNVARTGLTYTNAKAQGYDAVSVLTTVDDKAHYYPDASWMVIKLIADRKTEKLLGLQVLGKGAVDKIADIAVTAISLGATLSQLESMDLAYAPPFSTAIHPFSHTLNVLQNKLQGIFESVTPQEYAEGKAEDYTLVDCSIVHTLLERPFINLTEVNGPLAEYPKDQKLLLVCTKGKRAYMLQNRLKHFGYTNTLVLEGGTTFNNQIDA